MKIHKRKSMSMKMLCGCRIGELIEQKRVKMMFTYNLLCLDKPLHRHYQELKLVSTLRSRCENALTKSL